MNNCVGNHAREILSHKRYGRIAATTRGQWCSKASNSKGTRPLSERVRRIGHPRNSQQSAAACRPATLCGVPPVPVSLHTWFFFGKKCTWFFNARARSTGRRETVPYRRLRARLVGCWAVPSASQGDLNTQSPYSTPSIQNYRRVMHVCVCVREVG
jgi:hypothetical protein